MQLNRLAGATIASLLLGARALVSAQILPGEGEGTTPTEGEPEPVAEPAPPPADGKRHKYQYWTNIRAASSLADFMSDATETPGSWWPH